MFALVYASRGWYATALVSPVVCPSAPVVIAVIYRLRVILWHTTIPIIAKQKIAPDHFIFFSKFLLPAIGEDIPMIEVNYAPDLLPDIPNALCHH